MLVYHDTLRPLILMYLVFRLPTAKQISLQIINKTFTCLSIALISSPIRLILTSQYLLVAIREK